MFFWYGRFPDLRCWIPRILWGERFASPEDLVKASWPRHFNIPSHNRLKHLVQPEDVLLEWGSCTGVPFS